MLSRGLRGLGELSKASQTGDRRNVKIGFVLDPSDYGPILESPENF